MIELPEDLLDRTVAVLGALMFLAAGGLALALDASSTIAENLADSTTGDQAADSLLPAVLPTEIIVGLFLGILIMAFAIGYPGLRDLLR